MTTRLLQRTLLLAVAGLAGCMPFTGADPVRIVAPDPVVDVDPSWPTVEWTLLVQRPVADQTRGSTRIIVRPDRSRLALYPGVAWLDELPEMLQAELLRALGDHGRIPAVVRPGVGRARYALATEIRRFDAVEHARGRLGVELELHAALLEVRSGDLLGNRVFRSSADLSGSDVEDLTAAFEAALAELLGDLTGWVLTVPAGR